METRLVSYSLGIQLVISTASLIFAQEYDIEIPLAIADPTRMQKRLDTFKFAGNGRFTSLR